MEAKQKERPDNRGKRRFWKKFEGKAEGKRVGQLDDALEMEQDRLMAMERELRAKPHMKQLKNLLD